MSKPRSAPAPFLLALAATVAARPGAAMPDVCPQDPPAAPKPGDTAQAPPVVVTASRSPQDPFTAPRAVDVIGSQQLQRGNARTLPQALRGLPSTMIQETAPGQGSPFLRGFTGYQNLLLIDGIRLNNSTFRNGPNQYWSTIDPLSIERIEVVRGPSSTLYGSDAIGGTVQVFTRSPQRRARSGTAVGGSLFGRYATAEDSAVARAEYEVDHAWQDGSHTGFLVGGTSRTFGTLEGGADTDSQPNTDHDEQALDLKVEHWFDSHRRLVFLSQTMRQDNVPRTHATVFAERFRGTAAGTDLQRDFDQRRRLTYLQYHATDLGGAIDGVHLSVSWQEQHELEDRILNTGVARSQAFDVGTAGVSAQLDTPLGGLGTLTWGADWYHDNVNSWSRRSSGGTAADAIQGAVANDAEYDLVGVFAQDVLPIGERTSAQVGVRYTWAAVDAGSVRDPSTNQKIALDDDWDAVTASAHLRHDLVAKTWNVYGGVSQGFRTPSLSDLSQFDTARSGETEVPAPGLDTEQYLGYEVGTKVRATSWTAQAAWYYTDIDDQIQRFPTGQRNGTSPIVTKANVGDGYIQGAELQFACEFAPRTSLFGAGSWQYGRVSNVGNNGVVGSDYPSRLMPPTALLGLRWEDATGRLFAETFVVHAEDADRTSSGDNRDTQRIPPGGTPGYTIWSARGGWSVTDAADLEVALENITDVDYRVHGSGSNAPGTNLVLAMRVTF
ncbi:MAG: TonB-dependent receptor [Planctomycetota bacterium]